MSRLDPTSVALVALAAALNVSLGAVVAGLKLPIYLDSVGTVVAAVLGGWQVGLAVGALSVLTSTLVVAPTSWAYAGTAAVIALVASALRRFGFLKKVVPTVLGGLVIGLASAVVSAPVTTFLYGGVSFTGSDALTAFFYSMGNTLLASVALGGLSTDPVDKVATAVIALLIVRALPRVVLGRTPFGGAFTDDGPAKDDQDT